MNERDQHVIERLNWYFKKGCDINSILSLCKQCSMPTFGLFVCKSIQASRTIHPSDDELSSYIRYFKK
jgi:hypothetical protein